MERSTPQQIFGDLLSSLKADQTILGFQSDGDIFEAEFNCSDPSSSEHTAARTHTVQFALVEQDDDAVVMIISWIGPASPARHGVALRANASFSYGRIALIESDGVEKYAVVYYHRLSELIPEELMNAAREVAVRSDSFSQLLTDVTPT